MSENAETVDSVIDLSKYTHCKMFADDELVMFTDVKPSFDLKKKAISFSQVSVKECFQGKYLGTDFIVELYEEENQEEPSIFFYDSGIIKFGLLELIQGEAGRFVLVDNMEFEFDWAHDIKERLDQALEQARIEAEEARKREIHVGDRVSFKDSYSDSIRYGTVKARNSKHSIHVQVEPANGASYTSTRYMSEDKLTKVTPEENESTGEDLN